MDTISQFHHKITSESFFVVVFFFNDSLKLSIRKNLFVETNIITFSEHEAKGNKNIKMNDLLSPNSCSYSFYRA